MTDIQRLKDKIKSMSESDAKEALQRIAIEWYIDDAGKFNRDKELDGADTIFTVTEILDCYGVRI
jgi:hypothetical protein